MLLEQIRRSSETSPSKKEKNVIDTVFESTKLTKSTHLKLPNVLNRPNSSSDLWQMAQQNPIYTQSSLSEPTQNMLDGIDSILNTVTSQKNEVSFEVIESDSSQEKKPDSIHEKMNSQNNKSPSDDKIDPLSTPKNQAKDFDIEISFSSNNKTNSDKQNVSHSIHTLDIEIETDFTQKDETETHIHERANAESLNTVDESFFIENTPLKSQSLKRKLSENGFQKSIKSPKSEYFNELCKTLNICIPDTDLDLIETELNAQIVQLQKERNKKLESIIESFQKKIDNVRQKLFEVSLLKTIEKSKSQHVPLERKASDLSQSTLALNPISEIEHIHRVTKEKNRAHDSSKFNEFVQHISIDSDDDISARKLSHSLSSGNPRNLVSSQTILQRNKSQQAFSAVIENKSYEPNLPNSNGQIRSAFSEDCAFRDSGLPPPMPKYTEMSVSELETQLREYGVKPGNKKFMVQKMQEIWVALHSGQSNTTIPRKYSSKTLAKRPRKAPKERSNSALTETPLKGDKRLHLVFQVHQAIQGDKALYEQLLLYQKVPVHELHQKLSAQGIKVPKSFLVTYLEHQGLQQSKMPASSKDQ